MNKDEMNFFTSLLEKLSEERKALVAKLEALPAAVEKALTPKPIRRVRISQLDLMDSGISVAGLWISSYNANEGTSAVKECWLIGDEFVFVGREGVQGCCSMGMVKCWVAAPHQITKKVKVREGDGFREEQEVVSEHIIDWLTDVPSMTSAERDIHFKMKR